MSEIELVFAFQLTTGDALQRFSAETLRTGGGGGDAHASIVLKRTFGNKSVRTNISTHLFYGV